MHTQLVRLALLIGALSLVGAVGLVAQADTTQPSGKLRRPREKAEIYFVGGGGSIYTQVIDFGQSGSSFGSDYKSFNVVVGLLKRRTRTWSELYYQYSQGTLTPEVVYTEVSYQRFDIHYRFLTRVHRSERRRMSLFAGGEIGNTIVRRINPAFANNSLTFESITSLSAAGGWQYDFRLFKRDWRLLGLLTTPLLAYVARPSFATTTQLVPFTTEESLSDYLSQGQLVGPNRLFRLNFLWSLDYPLGRGNALRLNYGWDYFSYTPAPDANAARVQSALHTLSLALLFRF